MRSLLAAEKGEDKSDVPQEQSHFYHDVGYVIRTWLEHRLHHTYPEMGGYNDQDEYLMRDWHTLSLYYVRAEAGVFTAVQMPTNAPHYSALMGD